MTEDVRPAKSDCCDPKPVLRYAAQRAVESGFDRYVITKGGRFVYATTAPPPQSSHWKVDRMAWVFAHMGGQDVVSYLYESRNNPGA